MMYCTGSFVLFYYILEISRVTIDVYLSSACWVAGAGIRYLVDVKLVDTMLLKHISDGICRYVSFLN